MQPYRIHYEQAVWCVPPCFPYFFKPIYHKKTGLDGLNGQNSAKIPCHIGPDKRLLKYFFPYYIKHSQNHFCWVPTTSSFLEKWEKYEYFRSNNWLLYNYGWEIYTSHRRFSVMSVLVRVSYHTFWLNTDANKKQWTIAFIQSSLPECAHTQVCLRLTSLH